MFFRTCVAVWVSMLCLACEVAPGQLEDQGSALEQVEQRESPIIGGAAAVPGQFPWQARLTVNGQHQCGGSLIHPSWVLTAAHCVQGVSLSALRVIMGDHRISQNESTQQVRSASRVIIHPNYRSVGGAPVDDVALIALTSPVTINASVQTVQLQRTAAALNVNHTVSGWGWPRSAAYAASDTLLHAAIPVVDNAQCDAAPLVRDLLNGELCAGFLNGTRGGCHGDSGGPLYWVTNGLAEQVGVVSWGRGTTCDTFTVFARVSTYVPWIEAHVGVPLRRAVRMSWNGTATSNGSLQLRCVGTGEFVTGPTNIPGVEISLNCPNSSVEASCSTNGSTTRRITSFTRTRNGVTTTLSAGYSFASETLTVSSTDQVTYACSLAEWQYCGNGLCESNEDFETCAYDCGWCGDAVCGAGETPSNCVQDCGYCGDGICCISENSSNCPQDCNSSGLYCPLL